MLERRILEEVENRQGQPPPRGQPTRSIEPWPWAVFGVGIVSLGVGAAFGGLFLRDRAVAEDPNESHLDGTDAYERAQTYRPIALFTLIIGGVLTTAWLVWALIDVIVVTRQRTPEQNDRSPPLDGAFHPDEAIESFCEGTVELE